MLADVPRRGRVTTITKRPIKGLAPTNHRPTGFGGQVEAQQRVIGLGDLESSCTIAILLGQAPDFVIEDIRKPLQEKQR
ncbi:hypothetical protein D3C77_693950 [compost metagenome]